MFRVLALLSAMLACGQPRPASQSGVQAEQITLPAGLSMTLRLETTLDSERSKEGDPVIATVLKDAKLKGQVIVPARAKVRGHIRVLDRKKDRVAVGLEFSELEFAATKAHGVLFLVKVVTELPGEHRVDLPSLDRSAKPSLGELSTTTIVNEPPGVGTLIIPSGRFKIPRLEMVWRTLPPA